MLHCLDMAQSGEKWGGGSRIQSIAQYLVGCLSKPVNQSTNHKAVSPVDHPGMTPVPSWDIAVFVRCGRTEGPRTVAPKRPAFGRLRSSGRPDGLWVEHQATALDTAARDGSDRVKCVARFEALDVRNGSKADIDHPAGDVRYWVKSRHAVQRRGCPLIARSGQCELAMCSV